MPKEVNILPNGRVDINDFKTQTSELSRGLHDQHIHSLVLGVLSGVLEGFRVEIPDQTSSPGEFTIVNGNAFDRRGRIINNEDDARATRSHTLAGDGTYYVEVELTSAESDVDARAFWDPDYSNGTDPSGDPRPDGREFDQNVATRITPDWQIVTPPATSDFTYKSTPSTNRVPVCVLTVSGGQITGGTTVPISSVVAEAIAPAASSIRLLDTRAMPDSFTLTLDPGGPNDEDVTVSSNDRENGILALSATPSNSHAVGTRAQEGGGSPTQYLAQREASAIPTSGTEDARPRVFQGDEDLGYALGVDPDRADERSDASVASLQRYVDFLAAQVRELKFGAARDADVGTVAPPSSFAAAPRYFDAAGGVQGGRTYTVTVGDGVNSWGDFNATQVGSASTAIQNAIDALPGSQGIIFIKKGSYSGVNVTLPFFSRVMIIGEGQGATSLTASSGTAITNQQDSHLVLRDLTVRGNPGNFAVDMSGGSDNELYIANCEIESLTVDSCHVTITHSVLGNNDDQTVLAGNPIDALIQSTRIERASGSGPAVSLGATATDVAFERCAIRHTDAAATGVHALYLTDGAARISVRDSTLEIQATDAASRLVQYEGTAGGDVDGDLHFSSCRFITTTGPDIDIDLDYVRNVVVSRCRFEGGDDTSIRVDALGDNTTSTPAHHLVVSECASPVGRLVNANTLLGVHVTKNNAEFGTAAVTAGVVRIDDCDDVTIEGNTFQQLADTPTSNRAVYLDTASRTSIQNNRFYGVHICVEVISVADGVISGNTYRDTGSITGRAFVFGSDAGGGYLVQGLTVSNNACKRIISGTEPITGVGFGGFVVFVDDGSVNTMSVTGLSVHGNNVEAIGDNAISAAFCLVESNGGVGQKSVLVANNIVNNITGAEAVFCRVRNTDSQVHEGVSVVANTVENVTHGSSLGNVAVLVDIGEAENVHISNNEFRDVGDDATAGVDLITVAQASKSIVISDNTFRDLESGGSFGDNIIVIEEDVRHVAVRGNVVSDASPQIDAFLKVGVGGGGAVEVADLSIVGNIVPPCRSGIDVTLSANGAAADEIAGRVTISDNVVADFSATGIGVSNAEAVNVATNVAITGNAVFTSDQSFNNGIFVAAERFAVTGNTVGYRDGTNIATSGKGIHATSNKSGSIVGNTVHGKMDYGIDADGTDHVVITGNMVDTIALNDGTGAANPAIRGGNNAYIAGNVAISNTSSTGAITHGTNSSEELEDTTALSPNNPGALGDANMNWRRTSSVA